MRHVKWMNTVKCTGAVLSLAMSLSIAACTAPDGKGAPVETSAGTDTVSGSENPSFLDGDQADMDTLLNTAALRGSVADFEDGKLLVSPDQDDGQTVVSAAPGMENSSETTTVTYGEDCEFLFADVNISSGNVSLKAASALDIKKSTLVYVYGETGEDGSIRAARILLPRYE